MLNILIITIITLVLVAVFAVSCHKEPEKTYTPDDIHRVEFGTGEGEVDLNGDVIMPGAFDKSSKLPTLSVRYKEDEYGNPVRTDSVEIIRAKMLDHLTSEFNHKPKL